jgi:multiple sugar transport system permease protein
VKFVRTRVAALFAAAFLVVFFLSSITASLTVKEIEATAEVSMGSIVFSLSSPSVLMLPVSLFAMLLALISYLRNNKSAGSLFSLIAALFFLLFMIFYTRETANDSLYRILAEKIKEAGIKFRKRDVGNIDVAYSINCFITLALGFLACIIGIPNVSTQANRRTLRKNLLPYAYVGPHIFLFVVFFITPAIYGVYAAFTKWDMFGDPVWIGIENFRVLFTEKGNTYYNQLRNGLLNTFKFVLYSVPFCILVPLSLALALQEKPRGNKFFQAIYYLPALMSITTVTLAWRYMFFKSYGVMNNFFMSPYDWFTPPYSWIMLVVVTVWWVNGGTMVIYQSALASIPIEQYEAGSVDGANSWQKFIYITLPGMRYPLMYTLITTVIAQFNIYGQPLILTGYSNQEANAVLLMYVYDNAVRNQVAGISSAMALILGMCIMLVSFFQMRVLRRQEIH